MDLNYGEGGVSRVKYALMSFELNNFRFIIESELESSESEPLDRFESKDCLCSYTPRSKRRLSGGG